MHQHREGFNDTFSRSDYHSVFVIPCIGPNISYIVVVV